MARFDRYMLSQLIVSFGFFALVFVSIYWVNRAVVLFDRLIADGHSASVFLEFTALSLPAVIAIVLPMAAFAAAVQVTNRMIGDSEMTVMQATGYSPWRMARPVLMFGLALAVMMSLLSHLLVPASLDRLNQREQEISGNVSARLLREGVFLHPVDGVTFFIREITPEGGLQGIYLSDRRDTRRAITYTAAQAYLFRDADGPKLVLVDGMAQTLLLGSQRLSTTNFADFTFDIGAFIEPRDEDRRRIKNIMTPELLMDLSGMAVASRVSLGTATEELHSRFLQPFLCIVSALIGFATLVAAGFSRFSLTRQIMGAILLLVLVKLTESAGADPVRRAAQLWPLIYAPAVLGLGLALGLLHLAARNFRTPRAPMAQGVA